MQAQFISRPSVVKSKRNCTFDVTTVYKPPEVVGRKQSNHQLDKSANQILDFDFGVAEREAKDFEKDILNVLTQHISKEKWDEWWINSKITQLFRTDSSPRRKKNKRNQFNTDIDGDEDTHYGNEKLKDNIRMMTPEKHEAEQKQIEEKSQPKQEKMFYDDWTEPQAPNNTVVEQPKEVPEEPPKESNLINETFAKFGITEFLMSNKDKEEQERKSELDKIPKQKLDAQKYIVKLPDYSYLIDANVWFPDDFFG
jgi:hypothetical protein